MDGSPTIGRGIGGGIRAGVSGAGRDRGRRWIPGWRLDGGEDPGWESGSGRVLVGIDPEIPQGRVTPVRGGALGFRIRNAGDRETGAMLVLAPALPGLFPDLPMELPSIPPGGTLAVQLRLADGDFGWEEGISGAGALDGELLIHGDAGDLELGFVARRLSAESHWLAVTARERVDAEEGGGGGVRGLRGARVELRGEDSGALFESWTDRRGDALFRDLPAGRYRVRVRACDGRETRFPFRWERGQDSNLLVNFEVAAKTQATNAEGRSPELGEGASARERTRAESESENAALRRSDSELDAAMAAVLAERETWEAELAGNAAAALEGARPEPSGIAGRASGTLAELAGTEGVVNGKSDSGTRARGEAGGGVGARGNRDASARGIGDARLDPDAIDQLEWDDVLSAGAEALADSIAGLMEPEPEPEPASDPGPEPKREAESSIGPDGRPVVFRQVPRAWINRVERGPDGSLRVELASEAFPGWAYYRLLDPSNGEGDLRAVARSDGLMIAPGRLAWMSEETMPDGSRRRLLHLFDENGTGRYILIFDPRRGRSRGGPSLSVSPEDLRWDALPEDWPPEPRWGYGFGYGGGRG